MLFPQWHIHFKDLPPQNVASLIVDKFFCLAEFTKFLKSCLLLLEARNNRVERVNKTLNSQAVKPKQ